MITVVPDDNHDDVKLVICIIYNNKIHHKNMSKKYEKAMTGLQLLTKQKVRGTIKLK